MAGTVVADTLQADSTSTLVIKNGVANTPPTIQDSAGTQIGTFCRAWVSFDGTGTFSPNPSTTKIRASFNVSSILDTGTGQYVVNFTNAMPDANYAWAALAGAPGVTNGNVAVGTPTTLSVPVISISTAGAVFDASYFLVSVFR